MARSRKYRYITDPVTKAAVVVNSFVTNAEADIAAWQRRYRAEVLGYARDDARKQLAAVKLAGYYQGLSNPEVKSKIREAINTAKETQATVVSGAMTSGKLPAPAITPAVKTLKEKIAALISGPVVPAA